MRYVKIMYTLRTSRLKTCWVSSTRRENKKHSVELELKAV